ncbi:16S rRNA (cytidine(1402)-2'-O)-methyltransferase [Candidatus Marinimicrobia bacterium]|nr:16S rRNA (cytidine(1402)-2'-O)-methyltransferase [Candidatus Neomarinimicrobiota bacterium]
MKSKTGILYLVSTPIGNLGDMTFRAVEILKNVELVAAEDTRHSKKLFNHYLIKTPLLSYFEHNRNLRIPRLLDHLNKGDNIALITDAGTPAISDPAYKLVREVIRANIKVEPIPGASAVLSSLVASGLPTDRFIFEGFLPLKKGRIKRIESMIIETGTIIIYESPKRLLRTLKHLNEVLGNRPAVVAREITKLHEEFIRGTLPKLYEYYSKKTPKGECVILIGKSDENVYFN